MSDEVQPQAQSAINQHKSKILIILGIFLFISSIISSFFGGLYLNTLLATNKQPVPLPPIPSSTPSNSALPEPTTYIKGKQYFDDTIIAITRTDQPQILVATATRQENDTGVTQATRASFFDGTKWTRKILTQKENTTAIYTNDIIEKWQIAIDPSRVLKQTVQGSIKIDQNVINFDTGVITNNISVRSLPGYTKFMSTGQGNLTINNESQTANILYTRIYSNDSQEIQFYDNPFGLTTHWLAFWDSNNNFYHIDSTQVDKITDKYSTHQFAVHVDANGKVAKTFAVTINVDSASPPHSYQIELGAPINQNLTFTTQSSINKAPNNSYSWFMSNGTGQAGNIAGYGIAEYIHH